MIRMIVSSAFAGKRYAVLGLRGRADQRGRCWPAARR
jgi:hypothetical protein